MQNINKTKLLLAIAAGFFLLLGNINSVSAAAPAATNMTAAETYTEDTPLNLIDIVTSDGDGDPVTVTLTLSFAGAGSFNTGTSGAVTSTYSVVTGVWTASGAIANVNTLLAGLTFTPAADYNSSFILSVRVSDGTTIVGGDKNFTGIAVNDAPTATNLSAAQTYTEDTNLDLSDIVAADVDSASITATLTLSSPAVGSLTTATSGAVTSTYVAGTGVWTATGALANVNTLLAGVNFVPAADGNSSFTIATSVSDGVAPNSTGTKTITGTAVNDAPILNATKSPELNSAAYDSGPPSGADGVLVSSLVDFASPAGEVDNVTDVDTGATLGIAVIAKSSQASCYYSINGGVNWFFIASVSDSSSLLLAADADNRIYCLPEYGVDTSIPDTITFRAWDRTSGVDGGRLSTASTGDSTPFSSTSDTAALILIGSVGGPADPDDFVTVWKTSNDGESDEDQILFPAFNDAVYDIYWGDGSSNLNVTGPMTHTYALAGTYTVTVNGAGFNGMGFGLSGDYLKLLDITHWGTGTWKSMSGAFFGASNMVINAADSPDLSEVTDFIYTFRGTTFVDGIENWDVSNANSFVGMFQDAAFNGNIGSWDMSGATNLSAMFYNTSSFNQDISGWDTSNVTNMNSMFYHNTHFNQPIGEWDVTDVTDFAGMFDGATAFEQSLANWNIRNATTMAEFMNGVTLTTANYDATLIGWFNNGLPVHTGVDLDFGGSQYCAISEHDYFLQVPSIWDVTDGGYGSCLLELTEMIQIPTKITDVSDAVYHFSTNDQVDIAFQRHYGDYVASAPDCVDCAVIVDGDAHTVSFTGLRPRDSLEITLTFVIDDLVGEGESNALTVGPFSVKYSTSGNNAGGGQNTVPKTGAHPNGTLILDGQTIYLIKDGQRWGFRNEAEYLSYGYKFSQAVVANAVDLKLPFASSNILKAMPGTLVVDATDGKTVYMIGTNYTKRGFVSATVFSSLGYKFKNLPKINLSDYSSGPVITSGAEAHPEGSLVLDGKTVWWVLNNSKQGFESQQVLDTYGFTSDRLVKSNAADLALATGSLVKLRDGTLVQDGSSYYIISDGKKRMFNGTGGASSLGYNLTNFITATLSSYTTGSAVN